jgi:hypothetical protein
MTITEFLEARIAEDEREANVCLASPEHTTRRWVRVLAECAAKRAILALHEYEWMGPDDAAGKGCSHDYEDWPCPTIRAIGSVYADHPDYRQEWA